jgi:DNA-binding protein H-NS
MAKNRVPRSVTSSQTTMLDYQGLAWVVQEAFTTPHGFEVYKGYPVTGVELHRRISYIRTADLVAYLRVTKSKDTVLPISPTVVYKIRRELGLAIQRAPMVRNFEWTTDKLALLGTMNDRDLGAKLNVSYAVVRGKRTELGIKGFEFWTPANRALLGTRPDRELAELIGSTFTAVAGMRHKSNIRPFGVSASEKWQRSGAKPARYRNPETGETWNGFGLAPLWLRGKKRMLFVIDDSGAV